MLLRTNLEFIYGQFVLCCYLQDETDITLVIPHCLSRSSALYREAVIKAKINNTWTYIPSEELTVDEYKVCLLILLLS